jgi:hypothetical protein
LSTVSGLTYTELVAKTPDADRQAREYIDRVVESHRKNGYGLHLSKKRYETAVNQVAATFRELIDASTHEPPARAPREP